jgi:hypothetical protein
VGKVQGRLDVLLPLLGSFVGVENDLGSVMAAAAPFASSFQKAQENMPAMPF